MRPFAFSLFALVFATGFGAGNLSVASPRPAPAPASQTSPAKSGSKRAKPPKKHQATGEILSVNSTQLLLLHARGRTKQKMSFVLTSRTRKSGEIVKGSRVTVYYRERNGRRIAFRIRPARSRAQSPLPMPAKPHSRNHLRFLAAIRRAGMRKS
jgi:hypothetical protein